MWVGVKMKTCLLEEYAGETGPPLLDNGPFVLITRLLSRGSFGNRPGYTSQNETSRCACPTSSHSSCLLSASIRCCNSFLVFLSAAQKLYVQERIIRCVVFFCQKNANALIFVFARSNHFSKNIVIQGQ